MQAKDLIAASRKKSVRSPVYQTLCAFHGQLRGTLQRGADWNAMADYLHRNGVVDGRGNRPSKRTVQRTWKKVLTEKAGRKALRVTVDIRGKAVADSKAVF